MRYYERIGLLLPVPRTPGGIRNYGEESCRRIELMKCMRAAGVQVEALTEYVALLKQGDATIPERKAVLVRQREFLAERMAEMQRSIDRLDEKIRRYEEIVTPAERRLSENERNGG